MRPTCPYDERPLRLKLLSISQMDPEAEQLLPEPEHEQEHPAQEDPSLLQECYQVLVLACPLFIEGVASIAEELFALSYIGHLPDPTALSALVLVDAIYYVSGHSIISGLASALETLCGQAYGAGNHQLLAASLVRAQVVCMLAILPSCLIWGSGWLAQLLPKLGQPQTIANETSGLLQLLVPSLLLDVFDETVMQYLLSQGLAWPGMMAAVIGLAVCPLYNWMFVYWLAFGLYGAALAAIAIHATVAVLVLGYVISWDCWLSSGRQPGQGNWQGFSLASTLQGCYSYLTFSLPCLLFVTLEWWVWEILIVVAGWLPDAETAVAVMGLSMELSLLPWVFTYSIGTAAATRIAQELGAGQGARAERILRMSRLLALCSSTVLCAVVWTLQEPMVAVLTRDKHLQQELKHVLPVVAAGIICDSQVAVLDGLLSASGRQGMGAIINCTAYWLIGPPISCLMAFRANWGMYGLRVGLLAASVCQGLVMHVIAACRFDWDKEVDRARLLVGDDDSEESAATGASEQGEESGEDSSRVPVALHNELHPEVHPELHHH